MICCLVLDFFVFSLKAMIFGCKKTCTWFFKIRNNIELLRVSRVNSYGPMDGVVELSAWYLNSLFKLES